MIAGERPSIAFGMSVMSLTLAPVTARTASRLQHHHRGTDRHAIIEVLDILVDKSNAAARGGMGGGGAAAGSPAGGGGMSGGAHFGGSSAGAHFGGTGGGPHFSGSGDFG